MRPPLGLEPTSRLLGAARRPWCHGVSYVASRRRQPARHLHSRAAGVPLPGPATATLPPPPPARWHAEAMARLGKCIIFGCSPSQMAQVARIARALATEWRTLVAGCDGFLTRGRRGLDNQAVVWGEMDSFQHVNNTAYIRYAEASRVNWVTHFASLDAARASEWRSLMSPRDVGLIMKSIRADYKFPLVYPDRVSVYHKLASLPTASDTSLALDCVVLSHKHRRPAARTVEDVVIYDYQQAQKTTMPPFVLDVLQDTWRLQELEKQRARTRTWELLKDVECLEKGTWDHEDAVEDMGPGSAEDASRGPQ